MHQGTATIVDAIRAPERSGTVALVDAAGPFGELTYDELDRMIVARGDELGLDDPSIVVLTGRNSVDWIVTYLSLLDRGHVPLLAADATPRAIDRIERHWSPAAVVTAGSRGFECRMSRGVRYRLHGRLALLMSTSGSTGSPKLIRLSHRNLVANARSIVEFQRLTPRDRGITNLPLHYTLGLSVLHSHLVAGAGVVVSGASVVDPCFADALSEHAVTNLAGVPHTFELLDQVGPERLDVPTLRFLAQAGGRLAPDKVATWAERADSWGASWFTMYGQTEATARISYVPPESVASHPGAIGRAIPGGELTIVPIDDEAGAADVGELVYRGDNVMMGYALDPADLALGHELDELRTGDLARRDPESGLFEIVGRRARRVKPFGVRIDLDDVERQLAAAGIVADVAGNDDIVVAASTTASEADLTERLVVITELPAARCVGLAVDTPRRPSGKIDGAALLAAGIAHAGERVEPTVDPADGPAERLAAEFGTVLGLCSVQPTDSFVSVGGDSLSYVECSVRAERIIGDLPNGWHLMPISELALAGRRRRLARVDTTVLLRAIGILAVVSTHMRFWHVPGGAHLMLGVVGYNVARFLLPVADTRERVRAGLRTIGRVAVPTVLWTALFLVLGQYTWHTLTLVNNYIGPRSHAGNHWHFWFIEVFVHLVLITTAVTAIPFVRRLDVRWPYAFPLVLLGLVVTLRLDWADLGDWYNLRFRTHAVAWFFVLGWLVLRSRTLPQKLVTTAVCFATAPGVFMNPQREFFIASGLVLLVWARELPMPRPLVRPLATLAAASMWIFISHFMIWPPMKELFIVEVAYPLTVLASLGVWYLATQLALRAGAVFSSMRRLPRPVPRRSRPAVHPL